MPKGRFEKLFLKGVLWVVIVALLAFSVFLFGATWRVYKKERAALSERENATSVHTDLLDRKASLEASLEALSSERGMEAELRERFPVVKDGEEVIVLVDAKNPNLDQQEPEEKGFFEKIGDWFGF